MRFLRRSLVGLFLMSVTIGLLAFGGQMLRQSLEARWASEQQQRPARERVFAANVVTFEPRTITPVLQTFGEIRSRRAFAVRAPVGGTIVALAEGFEDGGTVTAGQLLFRTDPREAQSALDVAQAELDEAEADLRDTRRALALAGDEVAASEVQANLRRQALERQQDLLQRGVGTEAAVETAALAAASADQAVIARRQSVAQNEARIDQITTLIARRNIALSEARRRLEDTEVRAEFSGTLSNTDILQGGIVSANQQVATLVDTGDLEVSFRVSTAQFTRLIAESGDLIDAPVRVSLDVGADDLTATGRISRVSVEAGEGQTGRLLFARLGTAPGFRPGDFVTLEIEEPALNFVAALPAAALSASQSVLVVGEEDRLEEVTVTLMRQQGDDVIVRSRELIGREIVAERTPVLGAGIRIRPIRQNPDGSTAAPDEPEMVALTPEVRAQMIAFVQGNKRMPEHAKERILNQLAQDKVPAQVVERIQSRMGG